MCLCVVGCVSRLHLLVCLTFSLCFFPPPPSLLLVTASPRVMMTSPFSVCCVHFDLELITSDNLVVLFPKFKSLGGERAIESCRERPSEMEGAHRACWRHLPFVEYSVLIAYRFLISESFGVNRTHNFHSYCSLGFVNCHPTGRIKSKLKALTIDSI